MMQRGFLFCSLSLGIPPGSETSVEFNPLLFAFVHFYAPNLFILALLAGDPLYHQAVQLSLTVSACPQEVKRMVSCDQYPSYKPQGRHENNDVCETRSTLPTAPVTHISSH